MCIKISAISYMYTAYIYVLTGENPCLNLEIHVLL